MDFLRRLADESRARVDEGAYGGFAAAHRAPDDVPSLAAAVRRDAPWAFLAEVKPASPNAGALRQDAAHPRRALDAYLDHGVTGISVLTQEKTFGGSLELLRKAALAAGPWGRVPVLMKDFLVHEDQLAAGRAAGASAVLVLHRLIEKGLTVWDHPDDAVEAAHGHGLEVLLEVDNAKAFEHAASSKADLLGINNRDLGTLEMDPDRAADVLRHRTHLVPDTPVLSLSGIGNRSDVLANHQGGLTGVLVGTRLMQAEDPRAVLRALRGVAHVKCCGAGHREDPEDAVRALGAADAVGVVVATPDAPRDRSPREARALFERLPAHVERVMVSTHHDPHELAALVDETGATHLQWHQQASVDEVKQLRHALAPGVGLIAILRLDGKAGEQADGKGDGKQVKMMVQTARALARHADRLLLDAKPRKGEPPGGTGHRADWDQAARIVGSMEGFPVVLAGGLDADNLREALRRVRPWGVDISSGTEDAARAGVKDAGRVLACLRAARRVWNLDLPREEVDRLRVL